MADLKVNYESMNDAAGKVAKAESELESLISNLSSVASLLGNDNQGQFYQSFITAWDETKPQLERMKVVVGEYAPKLRNAANTLRETDASIKF